MNITAIGFDRNDEKFPSFEVSDEALERAAAIEEAAAFTIRDCTVVIHYCPEH